MMPRFARRVSLGRWLPLILLAMLWLPQTALAQAPPEPGMLTYDVRPGDSLAAIAARYGVPPETLLQVNGLADPRQIYAGQRLQWPAPADGVDVRFWTRRRMVWGESLDSVACARGISWRTLAQVNRLTNPASLLVGQMLLVPEVRAPAALGPERRPCPTSTIPFTLTLAPQPVVRGQTVLVALETPSATQCSVSLLDQTVPCYERDATHRYGLLGLSPLLPPGRYTVTVHLGATSTVTLPLAVAPGRYDFERIDLPPSRRSLLDPALVQAERTKLATLRAIRTPTRYWEFPFRWPVEGSISSYFGSRRSYGRAFSSYHMGNDFRVEVGTPVHAPAAGVVVLAEPLTVRGTAVILDHGWGVMTGYWHLSRLEVTAGQRVAPGQVIAETGNTGLSTGAHLHWEMWVNGVSVDALPWTEDFTAGLLPPTP